MLRTRAVWGPRTASKRRSAASRSAALSSAELAPLGEAAALVAAAWCRVYDAEGVIGKGWRSVR